MTEQVANWALHCDELCLTLLKSSTLSRCVSWQMQRLRNFCHSFRTSSLWAWKYNEGSWHTFKQHSGWKSEADVVNGLFKYLYCVACRVLHFNKSLAFVLEFVHLGLVGQQTVVLEILNEIKSKFMCEFIQVQNQNNFCHTGQATPCDWWAFQFYFSSDLKTH